MSKPIIVSNDTTTEPTQDIKDTKDWKKKSSYIATSVCLMPTRLTDVADWTVINDSRYKPQP